MVNTKRHIYLFNLGSQVKLDTPFLSPPCLQSGKATSSCRFLQTLPFIYRVLPTLANLGRYLSSSRRAEDEYGNGRLTQRNPDYFARSDSKLGVRKMEWDF